MPKWLNFGFYLAVILLIFDAVMIFVSVKIVHALRLDYKLQVDLRYLLLVIGATLLVMYVMNVYQFHRRRTATNMAIRTFAAITFSMLLISSFLYVTKSTDVTSVFWRGNFPLAMIMFGIVASVVRYLASIVYDRNVWRPNWLVVGNKVETQLAEIEYKKSLSPGSLETIDMESFNDDWENILSRTNKSRPTGVILADEKGFSDEIIQALMHVRLSGTPILGLSDFYEQYMLKIPVQTLKDSWFIFSQGFSLLHHDVALKIKRIADILISAIGLVVAIPLMLLVALVILISDGRPILYSQERYGQSKKRFKLTKFRTMIVNAEVAGAQWSQPNDQRVTPIGKFLRATRLDELPQLWNVLKGEMSFIGPRPERPDFVSTLEVKIPYYDLRHLVKPGITGWAQVMYPYGRSVEDALRKLEYDLYYIKNYSIALDVYILLRTIRTVFSKSGV